MAMEINALGMEYFDDYRMSANSLKRYQDAAGQVGGARESFANLLEKAAPQAAEAVAGAEAGETAPALSRTAPTIDKTDKLYEQCLELETFLVKTLVSSMRNTVQKSGLINEGFAGKMYEDMLYDEYAKEFTKNAGFGFADQAYLELTGQRGYLASKL